MHDMEAELMCGVCLEYFDKPLMLPCTHNFCKKCIEGILSTNSRAPFYGNPQQRQRPKYHLDCPLCQRSIDLERGVESLTQNRILENIIALHRKNEPLSSNDAAWKLDSTTTDSLCLLHDSEPMSLYCLTCNRAVCKLCDCLTSKVLGASHKCVPIREQTEQYQLKISSAIAEIKRKVVPIHDNIQLLEDMMVQIKSNEDSIKNQLDSQINGLIQALKTQHEELLRQLNNDMMAIKRPIEEHLKKHKQLKKTVDDHLKRLNGIKTAKDSGLRIKLMKESERQLNSLLCFDMVMFTTKDMPTVDMPTWEVEQDPLLQTIKQLQWKKVGGSSSDISSKESSRKNSYDSSVSEKSATSRQGSREEEISFLPGTRPPTSITFDTQPSSMTFSDNTVSRSTMTKKHKPKKMDYGCRRSSDNYFQPNIVDPPNVPVTSGSVSQSDQPSSSNISSASLRIAPSSVNITSSTWSAPHIVPRTMSRAASVPPSMPGNVVSRHTVKIPTSTIPSTSWFSTTMVQTAPRSEQTVISPTQSQSPRLEHTVIEPPPPTLSPPTVKRLQANFQKQDTQQKSNIVTVTVPSNVGHGILGQRSASLDLPGAALEAEAGATGGSFVPEDDSYIQMSKMNFPIPRTADFIPQQSTNNVSVQNKGLMRKPKNEVNTATLMAMVSDRGDIGMDTVIKSMETVRLGVKDDSTITPGTNAPTSVNSNYRVDRRFSTGNANLPQPTASKSFTAANLPTISARDFSPSPQPRSSSPSSSARRTLKPKKKVMR